MSPVGQPQQLQSTLITARVLRYNDSDAQSDSLTTIYIPIPFTIHPHDIPRNTTSNATTNSTQEKLAYDRRVVHVCIKPLHAPTIDVPKSLKPPASTFTWNYFDLQTFQTRCGDATA